MPDDLKRLVEEGRAYRDRNSASFRAWTDDHRHALLAAAEETITLRAEVERLRKFAFAARARFEHDAPAWEHEVIDAGADIHDMDCHACQYECLLEWARAALGEGEVKP